MDLVESRQSIYARRVKKKRKENKKKMGRRIVYLGRTLKLTLKYGLKERMVVKRFGERDIGSCAFSPRTRKLKTEKQKQKQGN